MWWNKIAERLGRVEAAMLEQGIIAGERPLVDVRYVQRRLDKLYHELQVARVLDRLDTPWMWAALPCIDLARLAAAVDGLLDTAGLTVEYQKAGWRVVQKKEPDAEA